MKKQHDSERLLFLIFHGNRESLTGMKTNDRDKERRLFLIFHGNS